MSGRTWTATHTDSDLGTSLSALVWTEAWPGPSISNREVARPSRGTVSSTLPTRKV